MNKRIAYADEFGNNSLRFESQGSHFIIATVVCNPKDISSIETSVDEIRGKHGFQSGELKSSKVASNFKRRCNILKDLVELDISVYAVIIDKRKLKGTGFKYKKSFYKFLNNLLYKELYRTYPQLELYVDEHGGNDYMLEFKNYVSKHHQKSLFEGSEFDVMNSKSSNLIQIADFMAGTLGYIFDETKKSEHSELFKSIIEPIVSALNFFPRVITFEDFKKSNQDANFDPLVAEVAMQRVNDYLDRAKGDDQQKIDQINFLNTLLLLQRVYFKQRYITTKEIFTHLNHSRDKRIQEEYFRTKVVGDLRDKGILISSSRKGYKIPTTKKDIDNFLDHGNKIILPMLNRIEEMRKAIKMISGNKLDVLDEYTELKDIIDRTT